MAEVLNCKGMKCPQPVLKAAIKANSLAKGNDAGGYCRLFDVSQAT